MNNINIMIVGVGGQGTLLASKIIGQVAMDCGLDVKQSEVHGLSQRGGSVVTYVRYGSQVASPLIELNQADYILAFEKLEALRWADYLKQNGILIMNEQEIYPLPVITGVADYPRNIAEQLTDRGINTIEVNAFDHAQAIGNSQVVNMILLGILAKYLKFECRLWEKAIIECLPAKVQSINLQAFALGWNLPKGA